MSHRDPVIKSSKPAGFSLTLEADIWLDIKDIWPDGDAPENPTVDDVLKVIRDCGGANQVIRDWDLGDDLTLSVDGKIADPY